MSTAEADVLRLRAVPLDSVELLLDRYGLRLQLLAPDDAITASYWGDCEAGLSGRDVFARADTPLHSLLHEACHVICMSAERRERLHRDAGGDDLEESAVCYLQILLADCIDGAGRDRLMLDMDRWGYSFRLGSTLEWFQNDAEDAQDFLKNHGLLDNDGAPVFRLRA